MYSGKEEERWNDDGEWDTWRVTSTWQFDSVGVDSLNKVKSYERPVARRLSTVLSSSSPVTPSFLSRFQGFYYYFYQAASLAPDLTAGWNPYYSDSGFATVDSGMGSVFGTAIGNGTSMHMTSCDGAALAISWNGTSITLHGTLIPILNTSSDPNAPSYTVTLDGTATTNFLSSLSSPPSVLTASVDVLASFSGLTSGEHQIALTLRNPEENDPGGGAVLAFDRAVLEVDAGIVPSKESHSSSSDSLPPTTTTSTSPSSTLVAVTSTVPDDAMAFRGQWSFVEGLLPGSSASFHTSTNVGDRAQLEFNGTAIALSGLTTPSSGAYNITLDGAPPLTMSARASFTASAPTLLYFTAGSIPQSGMRSRSSTWARQVNVTTVEPGATSIGAVSASRGLPRGTIAALVIGVALAIISFVIFGIFVIRRRRASRRKREMLVNPRISRAGRLSFLRPRRLAGPGAVQEKGETHDADVGAEGVLDISAQKQDGDDDDEDDDAGHRLSAADKGKGRAGSRNGRASQNSDGSFSIDLPDLTSSQGPRGHLPAFPSTPSPPTPTPSLTSPRSPRPRGPREMLGRESNRGILLSPISPSREGGLEGVDHGGYLL
ncbi:hypothetical protein A0H81_09220 [Grifola frondosa]|uniref:Uncharacterized protein n=1 Tax=Grifola frondosa TaxID=5627 RepID=A0A1C7M1P5_GRIFR|nr:hypothetical protein A0H81_09220 [Grifola frondosa]